MNKENEDMIKNLVEQPIDVNELIKDIDAKISEIEAKNAESKGNDALEELRETVAKINEMDNLDTNDRALFNVFLTFNNIKENYAQAKALLMSIGEKHPALYDKIKSWIEK